MSRRIRLGESLVEAGLINVAQLEEALARRTITGERIGEALVALGFISERDLVWTLAKDADIPFLEATELLVDPAVVALVSAGIARAHNLVPLRADGRALVVAMGNPFDIGVIRSLERASGRQIRTVTGDPTLIAQLVGVHYGSTANDGGGEGQRQTMPGLGEALPRGDRPSWLGRTSASALVTPTTHDREPMPPGGGVAQSIPVPAIAIEAGRIAANIPAEPPSGITFDRYSPRRGNPHTFTALIDQDRIMVLEYRQETAGFRVTNTRTESRRFATPESAANVVIRLLSEMDATNVTLSVVLQHFGSFFHTIALPATSDDPRSLILREVERSFNIVDPAIAYVISPMGERRDTASPGFATASRQVLIAGAPKGVVATLHARFTKARIRVEGLTVIPEVSRRLYATLDGSTEATAVLMCLSNGPHVAYFVNGRLELALDPPLALESDAPLDSAVLVDQLERGAVFLRQLARGTVATRLLLAAPVADYESLASTIEARTGMRVAQLGRGVGSPEMVVAMGAVIAARAEERLDLYPREPSLSVKVRQAFSGPRAIVSGLVAAAIVAAIWAGIQFTAFLQLEHEIARLQSEVAVAMPAVTALRASVQGRERIAAIRSNLARSQEERRVVAALLVNLAAAATPGAQLDSITVLRVADGWKTTVFGRARGTTGAAAVVTATGMYHQLQRNAATLRNLDFQVTAYLPRAVAGINAAADQLLFTVTFVALGPTGS